MYQQNHKLTENRTIIYLFYIYKDIM